MVMWQNKGREDEQRKKDRDQVQFRGQGRGLSEFLCVCVRVCVYLCCRLKRTRDSFVEACSSFCWPPQDG